LCGLRELNDENGNKAESHDSEHDDHHARDASGTGCFHRDETKKDHPGPHNERYRRRSIAPAKNLKKGERGTSIRPLAKKTEETN